MEKIRIVLNPKNPTSVNQFSPWEWKDRTFPLKEVKRPHFSNNLEQKCDIRCLYKFNE